MFRLSRRESMIIAANSAVKPNTYFAARSDTSPALRTSVASSDANTEGTASMIARRRLISRLDDERTDTDADVPMIVIKLSVRATANGSPSPRFKTGTRNNPPPRPRSAPSMPAPRPAVPANRIVDSTACNGTPAPGLKSARAPAGPPARPARRSRAGRRRHPARRPHARRGAQPRHQPDGVAEASRTDTDQRRARLRRRAGDDRRRVAVAGLVCAGHQRRGDHRPARIPVRARRDAQRSGDAAPPRLRRAAQLVPGARSQRRQSDYLRTPGSARFRGVVSLRGVARGRRSRTGRAAR